MKVILMVFLMLSTSTSILAQLNITSFPLASRSFNVKTLSLANATVSLGGDYRDGHINPAGMGTEGILNLSADVDFFYNPLKVEYEHYYLEGTYRFGKSGVSFSAQLLNAGEQVTSIHLYDPFQYKFNNKEFFLKAGYAYSVNKNFSLGMGLNYLYSGEASGTSNFAQFVEPVNALSMDLGLQYQFSREIESGILKPSFGVALTNFGKGVNYFDSRFNSPLPTRLQAGVGLTFISSEKRNDRNMLEIRVLQNASKIMARIDRKTSGSDTSYVAMNPFKALIKSWKNSKYFNGQGYTSVNAKDQI